MIEYILQEILGWAPSSSLRESHTEGLLLLLHAVNTGHTDPKRGLCPLILLHLMTEFSVFTPFQGIAPVKS